MMSTVRLFAASLVLVVVSGCATVQDYPRCYLFRAPTESDVIEANERDTQLFERAFEVEDIVTGRDVVLVNAPATVHQNIRDVWATTGCINLRREEPFNAEIIDKCIVARCQEFMSEYVAALNSSPPEQREETIAEIAARYDEFICH